MTLYWLGIANPDLVKGEDGGGDIGHDQATDALKNRGYIGHDQAMATLKNRGFFSPGDDIGHDQAMNIPYIMHAIAPKPSQICRRRQVPSPEGSSQPSADTAPTDGDSLWQGPWYGEKPDLSRLRVIGSRSKYLVSPKQRKKLTEPRTRPCKLLGYEGNTNYRILLEDGRIVGTPNAEFHEILTNPSTQTIEVPGGTSRNEVHMEEVFLV
ncbi:hypothetical protein AJ78_06701 [Emergomyces pasteurianus Ep9510]|uniref:Retroviral polymerase SH3-like domain-containing protein n=1 Tax=Emergomyces pasteurianus Ep9510 TaxID=1447872 RepID=A0A1J9P803_9EURO|nr:hypothetical protein AJ78_06701 [Emergomyces pasteurianus Ep9510]